MDYEFFLVYVGCYSNESMVRFCWCFEWINFGDEGRSVKLL